MRYAWLVCETTSRWSTAVRRFGPAALPSADDVLRVSSAAAPQIQAICQRAAAVGDAAVVLWVLERARLGEILSAIAASTAAGTRSLHLAALDQDLSLRGAIGRSARLALHEWQMTAILDAPQELVPLIPLVRRHLTAIRPEHPPLDVLTELASPS